ncbi:penicillin-binding protein [Candidatus Dojkabacteria bacterium]|uniref:peptidoglycan glycosyltransferase n=1 Tax=Candidatus Dojkabacteria bacterium TaxID=2099670 RepID=A0A955I4M9_9BACT|nr:penicillin-binding protein [Candidatus Dojkabacteria bacterium]
MKIKSINLDGGSKASGGGPGHRARTPKTNQDLSARRIVPKSSQARPLSRLELAMQNSPRNQVKNFWKKHKGKGMNPATRKKMKKVLLLLGGLFLIAGAIGGLWFFSYLQKLDSELPSVEDPFGSKEIASVIYDRNGVELYKLFDEYNRDPLNIDEIPNQVKWAFLAAEDIDFYTHQGFDPVAIIRCAVVNVRAGGVACGGSTITQQVVKITTDSSEQKIERKLKELLYAIKIEQAYTKDEILQLYLMVAPFGSNIYGLTAASEFYFGKEPKDLTIAEAAILASIVQSPYYLSPTQGPDLEKDGVVTTAAERVKERQEYVLGQLRAYKDKINAQNRVNLDDQEADDLFSDEIIDEALAQELNYRAPIATDKKAGHAVDYAIERLLSGNYRNGEEPFLYQDLQTGGYHIYTTIDYDVQQIAESSTKAAVAAQGATYNFNNAAVITTQPSTGEIIAMSGSKDYYGESVGCDADGKNCLFDPQVNIMNTRQSPGSSTKPYGTYEAYSEGKLFYGSLLPDVPVDIGGGYTIKNWNGSYFGITDKTTAGQMLRDSRNLPAIFVLETIGLQKFLDTMTAFGYTTYGDSTQFGPSVILGGADIYGIEHAQGYGVFANGGELVKSEIISRIEDRDGNVIYEHKPAPVKVADERAVYMLNETLLNNAFVSWDGRQVSAKSGTSEDNKDLWMVLYSPDFVTVAWSGNNNNAPTSLNSFGVTAVNPWVKAYMAQIGSSFPYFSGQTPFSRPGGIVGGGGCSGECIGSFSGLVSGSRLEGVDYAVDNIRKKVRVCTDQPNKLARPIDEALGLAQDLVAVQYISPAPSYQQFIDKYLQDQANQGKGVPNGGPTAYCDIDRTGAGISGPFFAPLSVTNPIATGGGSIRISGGAYSMDVSRTIDTVQFYWDCNGSGVACTAAKSLGAPVSVVDGKFDVTYNIPAAYTEPGQYSVVGIATDDNGNTGRKVVTTVLISYVDPNISFTFDDPSPWMYGVTVGGGQSTRIRMSTGGANLPAGSTVLLFVRKDGGAWSVAGNMTGAGANWQLNWDGGTLVTNANSTFQFYAVAWISGSTGVLTSSSSAVVQLQAN